MDHNQRAHALLSASGAKRWLSCPPSARLEEQFPDEQSEYAAEGELAHEICELKLRQKFTEPMKPSTYNSRMKKLKDKPLYDDEMQGYTDRYVEYIDEIIHKYNTKPFVSIENKVDYSAWVPEGFGTADCIICCQGDLHVIDFKYGEGVQVSATNNEQLKLYALGAYAKYNIINNFANVYMHVVQPRLDSYSEANIHINELLEWGEVIKPIADIAFAGLGEFKSGEHCRFCKAKYTCRARAQECLEAEFYMEKEKSATLTNEEIATIIERADNIKKWVEDIKKYALAEIIKGNEIPGWKAVVGTGKRIIQDADNLIKTLVKEGFDEDLFYTRALSSMTAIEKIVGKKEFDTLCKNYLGYQEGNPTLAHISDKRKEYETISATEEFKNN
jgi:hypothetical protein